MHEISLETLSISFRIVIGAHLQLWTLSKQYILHLRLQNRSCNFQKSVIPALSSLNSLLQQPS